MVRVLWGFRHTTGILLLLGVRRLLDTLNLRHTGLHTVVERLPQQEQAVLVVTEVLSGSGKLCLGTLLLFRGTLIPQHLEGTVQNHLTLLSMGIKQPHVLLVHVEIVDQVALELCVAYYVVLVVFHLQNQVATFRMLLYLDYFIPPGRTVVELLVSRGQHLVQVGDLRPDDGGRVLFGGHRESFD